MDDENLKFDLFVIWSPSNQLFIYINYESAGYPGLCNKPKTFWNKKEDAIQYMNDISKHIPDDCIIMKLVLEKA